MNSWVCLRCDWTGGGDERLCARCGVPLYRRPPTTPRAETPADDERDPPGTPAFGTSRRWVVVAVLVGLLAAAGIGDRLVRPDAADRAPALGNARGGRQETPAVDDTTSSGQAAGKPESSVGHGSLRTSSQYIRDAVAICDAETGRFLAATAGLGYPVDRSAWNAAAIRYSERALTRLRALTLPRRKGQRARFGEYESLVRREVDGLRRLTAAASAGHTARAADLTAEVMDLIHLKDRREPRLRSCPVAMAG